MFFPSRLALAVAASLALSSCAPQCAKLTEDATALVQSYQACASDTECVVVEMRTLIPESCLSAFQCSEAFPADADLDAFTTEAEELNSADCSDCSTAKCVGPDRLVASCNESTGLCEVASI